jgi:hypothetical protein
VDKLGFKISLYFRRSLDNGATRDVMIRSCLHQWLLHRAVDYEYHLVTVLRPAGIDSALHLPIVHEF